MITDLNKILVEWSYRTSDGKPDVNNSAKLILLEKVLDDFGWSREARAELLGTLMEAPEKPLSKQDKEKIKKMGLIWKGQGYGKENEKGISFKNDNGKLVKVDKDGDDKKSGEKLDEPSEFDRDTDSNKGVSPDYERSKSSDDGDTTEDPKIKKISKTTSDKVANNIDSIAQTTPENKDKIKSIMDKALGGEKLEEEESKFLSKWVRVVEPTEATETSNPKYKIYVARFEGDFRRTTGKGKKAEKVEMGQSGASKSVHKNLQKSGLTTERVSTFGGKKTAPNQIYNENGKPKIIEQKPTLGVEKTDDIKQAEKIVMNARGKKSIKRGSEEYKKLQQAKSELKDWARTTNSVSIGELTIDKQNLDDFEKGSDEYKKAAQNNREMADLAEKIALGDMDFIDMDEGVYPDNPKNREIVIKSSLSNMLEHFDMLGSKDVAEGVPAAELPDSTKRVLNKLRAIAAANPNGGDAGFDNPKQWFDAFEETMSEFANDDKLKEGWANFAEVYTAIRAMHNNGEGTEDGKCVLLPESSTLETVDVLQISKGTSKSKFVTLDGLSVKKGKGGASALTSKIKKAVMMDDEDGKKKQAILDMSSSNSQIYADDVNHDDYRKRQAEAAEIAGVDSKMINEVLEAAISKNPKSKVEVALDTITKRRAKAAPTPKKESNPEYVAFIEEENKQKEIIRQRLQSYYVNTHLTHMAYNNSVDVQDFGNDSVLSQKNDKGGSKLVAERRIKISSSDGIDTLAYAIPTYDVGFSDDGRSKNPGAGRLVNAEKDNRPKNYNL